MSPNAGGEGEVRGLSQWVQLYKEAQITYRLYDSAPHPPHSRQQVVPLFQSSYVSPVELIGGGGGQEPNHKTTRINPNFSITWSQHVASPSPPIGRCEEQNILEAPKLFLEWKDILQRPNSCTKSRRNSLEFSSLLLFIGFSTVQLCLENYISSNLRNLLQFLEFIYCTLWRKSIENHIPFRLV